MSSTVWHYGSKIFLFLLLFYPLPALSYKQPLLLKTYKNQQITGWLMSEKLDGIRAIWNGKSLTTRNGILIFVPEWFLEGFPPFALDGELWSKREDFENIQSIVMDTVPSNEWKSLIYNVFDCPDADGGLLTRLDTIKQWLTKNNTPYLRIVKQIECSSTEHLQKFHRTIRKQGGEGVVIRDPSAPYIHGRTAKALKVKAFEDSECRVIGYNEGKGKYQGLLGSLNCQLPHRVFFRIGSGFSDAERHNPPPIGSYVTFKHQGWTQKGKPRFPVFLRIRKFMPKHEAH